MAYFERTRPISLHIKLPLELKIMPLTPKINKGFGLGFHLCLIGCVLGLWNCPSYAPPFGSNWEHRLLVFVPKTIFQKHAVGTSELEGTLVLQKEETEAPPPPGLTGFGRCCRESIESYGLQSWQLPVSCDSLSQLAEEEFLSWSQIHPPRGSTISLPTAPCAPHS